VVVCSSIWVARGKLDLPRGGLLSKNKKGAAA